MAILLAIVLLVLGLLGFIAPQISLPLAVAFLAASGFAFAIIYRQVATIQPLNGPDGMMGTVGVTETSVGRNGRIRIANEHWRARSEAEPIPPGVRIRIVGLEGLIATVVPVDQMASTNSPDTDSVISISYS